jgi:5'-3' exonuclease
MLRKVELIKSYGIQDVLLVFDGQKVPLKAETHEKRKDYKQENKRLARKAMEEDDSSKANSHFQRVSPLN